MAVGDAMTVRVVTVTPKATVREAITRMLEEGIGSVAVCEGPRLVGIFTERDVLRVAGEGSMFGDVAVEDVMTPRPITVSPGDDIVGAAQLMAARRVRQLPRRDARDPRRAAAPRRGRRRPGPGRARDSPRAPDTRAARLTELAPGRRRRHPPMVRRVALVFAAL